MRYRDYSRMSNMHQLNHIRLLVIAVAAYASLFDSATAHHPPGCFQLCYKPQATVRELRANFELSLLYCNSSMAYKLAMISKQLCAQSNAFSYNSSHAPGFSRFLKDKLIYDHLRCHQRRHQVLFVPPYF
jgi:hypothetical protein